jgi:hypothetical protein
VVSDAGERHVGGLESIERFLGLIVCRGQLPGQQQGEGDIPLCPCAIPGFTG